MEPIELSRAALRASTGIRGSRPPRYVYCVAWTAPHDGGPVCDVFFTRAEARQFAVWLDVHDIKHGEIVREEEID